MQQLLNWYWSVPSETWVLILGAGGVSAVTQFGKKLLQLENNKVIQVLFMGVAFSASALQYLLGSHNLPPSVLGIHTAALMGLATPLYFFAIKPANNFINDLKAFKQTQPSTPAADAAVAAVNPPASILEENNQFVETGAGAPVAAPALVTPTVAPVAPVPEFQA